MDLFTIISDALSTIADVVFLVLPLSPVHSLSLGIGQQYLPWLNWFVPFDLCIPIFLGWLTVFGATLIVRAVMRYFGILG